MSLYSNIAVRSQATPRPTSFERKKRVNRTAAQSQNQTRFTTTRTFDADEFLVRELYQTTISSKSAAGDRETIVARPTPMVSDSLVPETQESAKEREIFHLASERLKLMARQYAQGPNPDETALRLEMLSARVLKLRPRVTEAHVEALANVALSLEKSIEERQQRLRARSERRAQRLQRAVEGR